MYSCMNMYCKCRFICLSVPPVCTQRVLPRSVSASEWLCKWLYMCWDKIMVSHEKTGNLLGPACRTASLMGLINEVYFSRGGRMINVLANPLCKWKLQMAHFVLVAQKPIWLVQKMWRLTWNTSVQTRDYVNQSGQKKVCLRFLYSYLTGIKPNVVVFCF